MPDEPPNKPPLKPTVLKPTVVKTTAPKPTVVGGSAPDTEPAPARRQPTSFSVPDPEPGPASTLASASASIPEARRPEAVPPRRPTAFQDEDAPDANAADANTPPLAAPRRTPSPVVGTGDKPLAVVRRTAPSSIDGAAYAGVKVEFVALLKCFPGAPVDQLEAVTKLLSYHPADSFTQEKCMAWGLKSQQQANVLIQQASGVLASDFVTRLRHAFDRLRHLLTEIKAGFQDGNLLSLLALGETPRQRLVRHQTEIEQLKLFLTNSVPMISSTELSAGKIGTAMNAVQLDLDTQAMSAWFLADAGACAQDVQAARILMERSSALSASSASVQRAIELNGSSTAFLQATRGKIQNYVTIGLPIWIANFNMIPPDTPRQAPAWATIRTELEKLIAQL